MRTGVIKYPYSSIHMLLYSGRKIMISRRAMVAGGAVAVTGSWPLSRLGAATEKSFLPQGLPEGVYDSATLEALP
jgi:hypothetical protein